MNIQNLNFICVQMVPHYWLSWQFQQYEDVGWGLLESVGIFYSLLQLRQKFSQVNIFQNK